MRREERDQARGRRAAARAKGMSAMAIALAQIGAAFDDAAVVNDFKIRVDRQLRLGPHHPAIRARFGARAALLSRCSLDAAIATVEHWWREERKAFQIANALVAGTRLPLEVLCELRLILRLMRLRRMQTEYVTIVAGLCDRAVAIAAE